MKISRPFARRQFLIYGAILTLAIAVLSMSLRRAFFDFHRDLQDRDLAQIARAVFPQIHEQLLHGDPGADGDRLCQSIARAADARVTLIRPDGLVVGDSEEESLRIEHHANRIEVRAALDGRIGSDDRASRITGQLLHYVAVPLVEEGRVVGIVRLARPAQTLATQFRPITSLVWLLAGLVAALGLAAMHLDSRRAAEPLDVIADESAAFARGEFERRVVFAQPTALDPLADALNQMARTLSERVRALTRERNEREAILASMCEGVLALDRDERIMMINRAAETLLGVRAADVVGRLVQEALRHAELQRFLHRARAGADLLAEDNLINWDNDRLLSVASVPLRDEQRRETGLLIVLSDVTRLHRLEGLRREFVANVSHELRTPITSIKGFIETLRDGAIGDPEHAARFLDIVARQADRLNAIIEDLLTLSRIERQEEQEGLELQNVDLRALLDGVAQHFGPRSEERHVRIEADGPAGLVVRANARLLEQAVSNLVDNALKFSEPGKSVRVRSALADGEARIDVADEGCGIAPQHLPRLFERFYRVDKARSRQMGGTGLGLAIVKHIMQAHAGTVTVQSQPGAGSTFTLHLPTGPF